MDRIPQTEMQEEWGKEREREVVDQRHREIEILAKVGNEPVFEPSADFAARLKSDIAWWAPVVKASGFVAED